MGMDQQIWKPEAEQVQPVREEELSFLWGRNTLREYYLHVKRGHKHDKADQYIKKKELVPVRRERGFYGEENQE